MPTRADILAATPKCPRLRGSLADRIPCGKPMTWHALTSPADGTWCCSIHGPMLSGQDAAMRAGFISVARVDAEAA